MADPVVGIVNGVPTSGTGTITTLGQVINTTNGPVDITAANTPVSSAMKALVVTQSPNGVLPYVANNADAVAAAGLAGTPVVNFNYGYNGATWDRLQVDGSKNLKVALATGGTVGLVAGTALAGIVSASQETSTIYNGTTALTPQFAKIVASALGPTTIVALTGGKMIRVIAWDMKVNAAVNVKWQSHTTGDITGLYYNSGQGDGVARALNQFGYFQTAVGEALDINLSGAVAVGGSLVYVLV